jgi:thiamine biosynthesis lipoprotein
MTTVATAQKSPGCLTRLRVALGTFVAIEAEALDDSIAHRGLAGAFAAIALVERLMHPFRPGSDLTALADSAPGTPLTVHPWTFEVLELSRELNQASLGIFDPCIETMRGRLGDLELMTSNRLIAHAPLRIDLGGIAKGYAVDRAVDALRHAGCVGGLVNAGGDLAVFGSRERRIVCGEHRLAPFELTLRDGAMASSDAASRSRPSEHRGYYHGRHRERDISGRVTVLAARAAIADGLTKCLLAGDFALNRRLLHAFDAITYGS